MTLTGRTILITGGSAGIGLAFALKFLDLGNEVIVTGRRQAVLDQVKAKHPKLHTIQSDVADPAQVAALAGRVKSAFPKPDVLMSTSGVSLNENLYSATKAAIHSYTQSLRFQLEETGVEVIELMPPAVKTDMTTELAEGGGSVISTNELVNQSFALLKAGTVEIRPGQSKQLAFMRRLAPNFINRQLWKSSKKLVPVVV